MLTIEKTEKILRQMKYAVCKLGSSMDTEFFCKIPFINHKTINTLITAFHVYNKICSGFLEISFNNGEKTYKIRFKNA